MRVTLLAPVASPWGGAAIGGSLDVPDAVAETWREAGVAVAFVEVPEAAPVKSAAEQIADLTAERDALAQEIASMRAESEKAVKPPAERAPKEPSEKAVKPPAEKRG